MNPTGKGRVLLWIWTILVCIFIMAPLLVMLAISLTATEYVSLPTKGLSLRWYVDLFGRPDFLYAGRNSIVLALQSTAAAILLGTPVAIASLAWGDAAAVATVLFLLIAGSVLLMTRVGEGGRRKVIFQ